VPQPFNVRTRVHEYRGGAWTVAPGVLYFSNFADGQLYRLGRGESEPAPLTPAPLTHNRQWRFADGIIDHGRHRWIGVREDHTGAGQAVNTIVAVDLAQPGTTAGHVIANGHDFVASPRLSPDGRRLALLVWDHPNMPWNDSTLYLATLDENGAIIGAAQKIAGGSAESIFQPEWSPDGTELVFISDRSGWWNFYRFTIATGAVQPIATRAAEFGQPQWNFGMATYAFAGPERIVCAYAEGGLGHLAMIDLTTGSLRPLDTPFTQFASLRANGNQAAFIAGAPSHPACVVVFDVSSDRYRILKKATDILDRAGPTSSASSTFNLGIQYWTSRGIAVLDVNYGGSSGFGRAYRDRLHLKWGVVDVDDCINGAKFLAGCGRVDANRMVISGGSVLPAWNSRFLMSMCLMPSTDSASTMALTPADSEPTVPASPAPFTPNGLVVVGTGLSSITTAQKLSARGMA
jgi:dipeptidyl aminopeptidase/acylaminoacyl peptidase